MGDVQHDFFTRDLSFIDCGMRSLHDFEVDKDIVSLTFHGNKIKQISNLDRYSCLRHLDLSSNQISVIDGMNNLKSLRTLNLSNNKLESIPVMRNPLLMRLDLSFNSIKDISGLKSLVNLQILFLHGNLLSDTDQVVRCLQGTKKLRHLVLSEGKSKNPICNHRSYPSIIWENITQITSLDYVDKFGLNIEIEDVAPPGVEDFLEFLTSENYPTSDDSTAHKFSERAGPQILQNMTNYSNLQQQLVNENIHAQEQEHKSTPEQGRIDNLERQITLLLEQQASMQKQYSSELRQASKQQIAEISSSTEQITSESSGKQPFTLSAPKKLQESVGKKKTNPVSGGSKRTDQPTITSLVKEVESEKNKRWKAEETVTELKTNVVNLKSQLNELKLRETALNQTINDLKRAVKDEQSKNEVLRKSIEDGKSSDGANKNLLNEFENGKKALEKEISDKNARIVELENNLLIANAKDSKRDQEASKQLRTLAREFEKLQDFSKTQISKVKALEAELEDKQLLLKSRYSLDSVEVKELVAAKVKDFERLKEKEVECLNKKLKESYDQYQELEDEFRMALYSEEARYNEIAEKLTETENKFKESQNVNQNAKDKNEKSTKMVQELTNVVKEQKGRLIELQKMKQDFQNELKSKTKTYDEQIESFREKIKELELLRNDKTKLAAHIQAQDSIIEGLRKERKLWEEELAKQGTSLAADRGRLEVRIESLAKELAAERKSMESERDSLKIKTKVIEDQTDTIKKLKEAVIERDNTIVKTRDEVLKERRELEAQLAEETKLRQDLQDEISLSTERKHALKEDIESLRAELEEKSFAYEELMKKWKQKSALIGQLEVQVKEKKSGWDKRESELMNERDKALSAATSAVEKLKETEFRLETELRETRGKFESERMELVSSCDQRLEEVEGEMREMLREHEKYKKSMDAKFNRLHSAISDFQNTSSS
ncbi:leucine-rich repeat and coiled-coil domain-containing protein 1-like [Symsagittifera roscoffensis]|uniref:leucine-rich repeat and coiled-coil domain-containing protein 1-like n=1 Tax=Symsagittifera roscoffensis TaxID=84072 RepID=UPI00307B1698